MHLTTFTLNKKYVASAIIGIFYEDLLEQFDALPLTVVYGPPNRQKSKAAKIAVSSCGNPKGM